jgi:predicted amidophosphoribosyltransferase
MPIYDAKVEVDSIFNCSNCSAKLLKCDGCGEYFEHDEDIGCDEENSKHYHAIGCYPDSSSEKIL